MNPPEYRETEKALDNIRKMHDEIMIKQTIEQYEDNSFILILLLLFAGAGLIYHIGFYLYATHELLF